jgi:hypothetical protein
MEGQCGRWGSQYTYICQGGMEYRVGFFPVSWKGTVDGDGNKLINKENSKHTVKKIMGNCKGAGAKPH